MNRILARAALVALVVAGSLPAGAEPGVIKIGVIAELSGAFADLGKKIDDGIKLYLKQNGDTVAGKKVQVIVRNVTGPAPDVAKRLAQELVTQDGVDILAGFGLTPNALAVTAVASEAKKPMLIMNAATSIITAKSPYVARFSFTLPQVSAPLGEWAAKNGIKKVFTIVSNYGPGLDAEKWFTKAFTKNGGTVVDGVRVPMENPEFAPYLSRARDAKPDAVFAFVPAGDQGIAFMKAYAQRGLAQAGIKLISTGDVTEDAVLDAIGDSALGVVTTHHYSMAHESPENQAFLKAYAEAFGPAARPDFINVGAYDAMEAIYRVCKTLDGIVDPDKFMAEIKKLRWNSPRGPIFVDPATREVVQTVYVRRVEKKGGRLFNVEFDKFPEVKDPRD
ncbi:MAG: ABC transporter substrate-binding protein [Myxococcales bacterium]